MRNTVAIIFLVLILAQTSCRDENLIYPPPVYFNYVPVNVGHSVIYDVDSTYYREFDSTVNVFHFQVMEIIESDFTDNEGRPSQRIERYKRNTVNDAWQFQTVWYSTLTASRFERVEENVRFVRLGFPIKETQTWNGNAYNTIGFEEYYYLGFHEPLSIATFTFDSALTIQQAEDNNFIHKKYGLEKYASHIGRVYKEFIDVEKYPAGVYKEGVVYRERIYAYTP
jgi:hypothetical protein